MDSALSCHTTSTALCKSSWLNNVVRMTTCRLRTSFLMLLTLHKPWRFCIHNRFVLRCYPSTDIFIYSKCMYTSDMHSRFAMHVSPCMNSWSSYQGDHSPRDRSPRDRSLWTKRPRGPFAQGRFALRPIAQRTNRSEDMSDILRFSSVRRLTIVFCGATITDSQPFNLFNRSNNFLNVFDFMRIYLTTYDRSQNFNR